MEQSNIEKSQGNEEIYQVLINDHRVVQRLLDELVGLKEDDDYRFVLVEEIRNELIPHARAEESVFYNTLRAVQADKGTIFHAYKEHLEAESILRTLQVMDRFDKSWKTLALKLKEALNHHIEEEESNVFDVARNAFTSEEAVAMGEAFEKLKPEFRDDGIMKNTFNMMINMMPPRIADKIRNFGSNSTQKK